MLVKCLIDNVVEKGRVHVAGDVLDVNDVRGEVLCKAKAAAKTNEPATVFEDEPDAPDADPETPPAKGVKKK